MSVFYDGDYTAPVPTGPLVRSTDPVTQSYLFRQRYHQRVNKWKRVKQGASGPHGSYLVEEGDPSHLDGGIVEWERIYAQKPLPRKEAQDFNHTYQFLTASPLALEELVIFTNSVLLFEYFETSNPETIPLLTAYRVFIFAGVAYKVGTASAAAYVVAENSTLSRWRGTIWERVTRYVKPIVFTAI